MSPVGKFGLRKIASGGVPPIDPCALNIGPPGADVALANLVFQFKADSLALADGTGVASWADSSGNGHTATRAVVAEEPIFASTSVPNGGPVVRFVDAGRGLDIAGLVNSNRSARTMYILQRLTPTQNTGGAIISATSVSGGWAYQPDDTPGDTVDLFFAGNAFTVGPPATCGWQVIAFSRDFAGNKLLTYRNGIQIQTQGFAPDNNATAAWTLGSHSGFPDGLIFDLAEIQEYSVVHSAATVLAQSLALRNRWQLNSKQGV